MSVSVASHGHRRKRMRTFVDNEKRIPVQSNNKYCSLAPIGTPTGCNLGPFRPSLCIPHAPCAAHQWASGAPNTILTS